MTVLLKAGALLLAAFSLVSASPVPPTSDEQRQQVNYQLVHQVRCTEGSGSAFRIGPQRFMSAAHVTAMHNCTVDGTSVFNEIQDGKLDISTFYAGVPKSGALKINCDGYHVSEWYYSIGYALGLRTQTMVMVNSTAFDTDDTKMHILIGNHAFIPGMSGGPVLNSEGEVVGMVNAYNPLFGLSFSRALKDTSLCQKA